MRSWGAPKPKSSSLAEVSAYVLAISALEIVTPGILDFLDLYCSVEVVTIERRQRASEHGRQFVPGRGGGSKVNMVARRTFSY